MKNLLKTVSMAVLLGTVISLTACNKPSSSEPERPASSENKPVSSENKPSSSENKPVSSEEESDRNVYPEAWQIPAKGWEDAEVTINFYSTMGQNLVDSIQPYIEEFESLYPTIKVNHTQPGGYDQVRDQIKTELSTGQGPDLAYCYPDHVALYNKTKTVVTLDNLILDEELGLSQEQEEDFIEGYYEEGRQFGDGLMYTLPFSKSTEVLYYNATKFTEWGLSVPDHWFSVDANDKTSMEYVCAKILEKDPECIPLGYDSEANWFITMTEQFGSDYTSATGDKFLFDNAENKDFVKKFKSWREKGYFTTQKIYGGYTSGLFVATEGEKSYMSIGSSAGATHQRPAKVDGKYPFEVGIAPIPQQNASNKKAISQGPSICLFDHKDPNKVMASWLFLKYLTTTVELQAQFSIDSGYVPVINSVTENPIYQEHLAKADGADFVSALSSKICLEQADTYFTSPAFIGSSAARDQVGNLLVAAFELGDKHDSAEFGTKLDKLFADAIVECEYNS